MLEVFILGVKNIWCQIIRPIMFYIFPFPFVPHFKLFSIKHDEDITAQDMNKKPILRKH